jgi:tetratricopeptide (TPR) repeat protein
MTRGFLAGLAVVVALGAAEPGAADQNDPRLDELFARLGEVESRSKGLALSRKIWSIWYEHGNPAVERVMRQGHQALRVGEPGVALTLFDQAARLAPDYAEAWNARATVHYHLGNYAKSLDDIERTLDLEPRHFGALSGRGLCYSALDKPDKALTAFEASLALNPHQPGTRQRVRNLRDKVEGREI